MPASTFEPFLRGFRDAPNTTLKRFCLLCSQGSHESRALAGLLLGAAPKAQPDTLLAGLELLGGIRNLNASRIAVLADLTACGWKETDFFALALQSNERFQRDEQVLTLFTYDLREYKQVPDWLNARFWANPENFGKYWW